MNALDQKALSIAIHMIYYPDQKILYYAPLQKGKKYLIKKVKYYLDKINNLN